MLLLNLRKQNTSSPVTFCGMWRFDHTLTTHVCPRAVSPLPHSSPSPVLAICHHIYTPKALKQKRDSLLYFNSLIYGVLAIFRLKVSAFCFAIQVYNVRVQNLLISIKKQNNS